jgi:hypothetical protein
MERDTMNMIRRARGETRYMVRSVQNPELILCNRGGSPMNITTNRLGHALAQWVYRGPSGRLVRIRQWSPGDLTPHAIRKRQQAGLPYTKYCLVRVQSWGAEYADLAPHDDQSKAVTAYRTAQAEAHCQLLRQA